MCGEGKWKDIGNSIFVGGYMDIKTIIGVIAVIVGFIGYAPYLRDTFRGTTKPHFFSWFLWGVMEGTIFFAQVQKDAGPGAWVMGFSALIIFVIAAKAFFSKDKNITSFDWWCFFGAILGIVVWQLTKDPIGAVIIITITDAVAFLPTYRKEFEIPNGETLAEYVASSIKHTLGILALTSYSIVTTLYPVSLVLTNGLFVIMVLLRRKKRI